MSARLITTSGASYELRPVSQTIINLAVAAVEQEFRAAGEPIDPPTYTTELGEVLPHDAASVRTDEEKALWEKHVSAVARLQDEKNNAQVRALLEGVIFTIPAEKDDAWRARQRRHKIVVPDDSDDAALWWHYLTTEVLVTPDDLFNAMQAVTLLSYKGAVDEDKVQAAFATFRNNVRKDGASRLTAETGQMGA